MRHERFSGNGIMNNGSISTTDGTKAKIKLVDKIYQINFISAYGATSVVKIDS